MSWRKPNPQCAEQSFRLIFENGLCLAWVSCSLIVFTGNAGECVSAPTRIVPSLPLLLWLSMWLTTVLCNGLPKRCFYKATPFRRTVAADCCNRNWYHLVPGVNQCQCTSTCVYRVGIGSQSIFLKLVFLSFFIFFA